VATNCVTPYIAPQYIVVATGKIQVPTQALKPVLQGWNAKRRYLPLKWKRAIIPLQTGQPAQALFGLCSHKN
jgi:hypothetical protein